MKNTYKLILLFALCMLGSCKKFLDTKPSDFLTDENYYTTEDHLNRALISVYDILGSRYIYGDDMLGKMGLDADESFYGRNQKTGISVYDVAATDLKVATFWRALYDGINRANVLLENINKPDIKAITKTNRGIIEGEARFLRAYYYFLLVTNYGDVPLKLKTNESPSETFFPRTPKKEVYEFIIAEMTAAEKLVKTVDKVVSTGQISKSAVRGILARVCLHMAGHPVNDVSKYAEARKWAELVINDSRHGLNPDYKQIFINYAQDIYDMRESIWEVEFWGRADGTYTESKRVGSNNGIRFQSSDKIKTQLIGYAEGYIQTTANHFQLYGSEGNIPVGTKSIEYSNDLRRDWTISPFYYGNSHNGDKVYPPATVADMYRRLSGKWRREYELVTPKSNNDTPQNFPLLRFSDVLLMFAEADLMATGSVNPIAVENVNRVRRRAYGKDLGGEVVRTIVIQNAGNNVPSGVTINITGGGGTGATAEATVIGGKVTDITITNQGSGYTTTPTVSFVGGGGATATAVITKIAATDADINPTSPGDFLILIQDERSRELAFECLRKGDLVRWNIFLSKMQDAADLMVTSASLTWAAHSRYLTNVKAKDEVWPIPARELGLNQGLTQNKGW